MDRIKKSLWIWAPACVWMAVIFFLSTRQKLAVTDSYVVSFLFFKTIHLIEYSALFLLLNRSYALAWHLPARKTRLFALLTVFLYGLSDELHQTFVPTREGKLRDAIIDTFGGCIGWWIQSVIIPKLPRKLQSAAKTLGFHS